MISLPVNRAGSAGERRKLSVRCDGPPDRRGTGGYHSLCLWPLWKPVEKLDKSGEEVYFYNALSQQTAVLLPDGSEQENLYDAEYLRAGMTWNGNRTSFSYYNGELLAENSQGGDTTCRYILGYGMAAGWNRGKEGYHYYHLDEQNSTAYITGENTEIKNHYRYDGFGVVLSQQEEVSNRILYTGQQYD